MKVRFLRLVIAERRIDTDQAHEAADGDEYMHGRVLYEVEGRGPSSANVKLVVGTLHGPGNYEESVSGALGREIAIYYCDEIIGDPRAYVEKGWSIESRNSDVRLVKEVEIPDNGAPQEGRW